MLHARLTTEVSSATARHGTPIEAVLTEPVFNAHHQLLLPVNSRIVGHVMHAKPAGKLHHNGELRIVFEKIETPGGQAQAMRGSLEGVEVASAANMKLDSEGGAHTTDSKSRFLSTGLAVLGAAAASHPESDSGASDGIADPATRGVAGGSGFKLLGAIVSLTTDSKTFSSALGFYGAGMSVYSHFLSRGKEVVFPGIPRWKLPLNEVIPIGDLRPEDPKRPFCRPGYKDVLRLRKTKGELRLSSSTSDNSQFCARQRLVGLHPISHDRAKQQQADAAQEWQVPVIRLVNHVACHKR